MGRASREDTKKRVNRQGTKNAGGRRGHGLRPVAIGAKSRRREGAIGCTDFTARRGRKQESHGSHGCTRIFETEAGTTGITKP